MSTYCRRNCVPVDTRKIIRKNSDSNKAAHKTDYSKDAVKTDEEFSLIEKEWLLHV
jgi:hypothetical protein